MTKGFHAMKAIAEYEFTSMQLKQILDLLMEGGNKKIFTDRADWVYIYLPDTHSTYPILKKIGVIIEEAVQIAIKLGMSPETFRPVGEALDSI